MCKLELCHKGFKDISVQYERNKHDIVFKDKKVRFTQALLKAGHTLRDILYKCHTYMLRMQCMDILVDKMHVCITFLQYALQFVYRFKKIKHYT